MNVLNAINVERQTHTGLLREHNEDAIASDLSIGLLLLADGMGGYKAGEVASEIAVLMIAAELTEAMQHPFPYKPSSGQLVEAKMLIDAVKKTNATIHQISQNEPQCAGMGTTLVAAIFTSNQLVVGHIGDSRLYRLRGESLLQLTEDHSFVQEQINAGLISLQQAEVSTKKNLVTRALGVDEAVELELQLFDVQVGDVYLMCSDGLSDLVADETIAQILLHADDHMTLAANMLIDTANNNGGFDNVSVIIAQVNKPFTSKKSWIEGLFKNKVQT
ncbi:MAG: Stp1/IreP family PP2C-type Ser/Thr phosphatase [Bdellovibrio sp.]|nr:Stp1/IreP family PP2C-type Ser/Thr phosphatase [Methylotenera sp.]